MTRNFILVKKNEIIIAEIIVAYIKYKVMSSAVYAAIAHLWFN